MEVKHVSCTSCHLIVHDDQVDDEGVCIFCRGEWEKVEPPESEEPE